MVEPAQCQAMEENKMNMVKKLAQEAQERKAEIEGNRNIPTDLIDRVKAEGLVKMWAPTSCGGLELQVSDATQMIREMAYYNASLAWVVGVTGCASLFAGYLQPQQAALLFEDRRAMVGGFAGPAGTAVKVDGGLRVSGRWSWGSGISHCSHVVGGVMLMDGGTATGTAIAFFSPDQIEMIDTWDVLGLKGTYSIDYQVDGLFVPDSHWSQFPMPSPQDEGPLYRFSFLGALSLTIAAVGLGLARRAVDEMISLASTKSPFGQGKPLSKRPEHQSTIGKIYADYSSATALYDTTIAAAEAQVLIGACTSDMKAKLRLAAVHAAHLSHRVVQEAYRLGGGSSIWKSHKLEELWRDMNVVSQHGMVSTANYRTCGSVFSGNDVPEVLL